MKAYVDNMLIKSRATGHHIVDLKETFMMLQHY